MSPTNTVQAFVGMGSNLGDRLGALRSAVAALHVADGVEVEMASPIYEAEAHTLPDQPTQPDHLNAVVQIQTRLTASALLEELKRVERKCGRPVDAPKWSPRVLDLDLLLFGDVVVLDEKLTIPHPRLAERRFVLQPLADLVHNLIIPGADGATVSDLLEVCPDSLRIERTKFRVGNHPQPPS